jgi:hypothetical protein
MRSDHNASGPAARLCARLCDVSPRVVGAVDDATNSHGHYRRQSLCRRVTPHTPVVPTAAVALWSAAIVHSRPMQQDGHSRPIDRLSGLGRLRRGRPRCANQSLDLLGHELARAAVALLHRIHLARQLSDLPVTHLSIGHAPINRSRTD